CAVSNHSFYIEYVGAKQYPSMLVLKDQNMQPLGDTVKIDTTVFHIIVTDKNGNAKGKAKDAITVFVKNLDNGDSLTVNLIETGDSTGVFQTEIPISVVDRQPQETQGSQIAMNGGDKVRIWYLDPTDETDSSEAFIFSKANFPVAKRGYLKDTDGNGSIDLLVIEYTINLKENIDSVKINFPNSSSIHTAKKGVDNISYQGNIVNVIFSQSLENGITGFSSALYTKGKSFLTYNNSVKSSDFPVYDSAGPVLNNQAVVNEREGDGRDTVTVILSESIELGSFKGEALLLIREGRSYPVNVINVLSNDPVTNLMTIICDLKGMKFTNGDSLKLNPEGEVRDFSGNKPHLQNRTVPVIIKMAPPRITYAYYLDSDFNGRIDLVKMGFNKPVKLEQLDIRLQWNRGDFIEVDGASISFVENSTTEILISINSKITGEEIATSGEMIGAAALKGLSADTSYTTIADSAAPVIYAARFFLSATISENEKAVDTLRVIFSEPVTTESIKKMTAFNLLRPENGIYYTFNVSGSQVVTQKEFIFFGTTSGVDYPQSGDSIWIQPEAKLSDFKGNIQLSERNRKVQVLVGEVFFSIKNIVKKVYPNPFNPFTNESVVIQLIPEKSRFPIKIDTLAVAVIYDKVGNVVAKLNSKPLSDGAEIKWNGTNRKGRIVGDGTYLCFLYFKGERERIFIGVKKR
ncbi:MAG: hypothetical protein N2053_03240, partial [Chitinispirillaceae bacterium]|nr:hypothetical protein [Chitinispirillaceae bacterium]